MSDNNRLKVVYDHAFSVAGRAEKCSNKTQCWRLYKETVSAFEEARQLEKSEKNVQVLDVKLKEFGCKIENLEKELKALPDVDKILALALKKDKEKDEPKAEELYLECAEGYLLASKRDDSLPFQKVAWRNRANKVMDRVTEIKDAQAAKSLDVLLPTTEVAGFNFSNDLLTPDEIEVLRDSSIINGYLFVPWMEEDANREGYVTEKPFCDPDGKLQLSEKQREIFNSWVRAPQLLGSKARMIATISSENITQEFVADCSFVSSLCIAAHHERKFKKRLISNIIHPQGSNGRPVFNKCGKYIVKLWYNGCARKVVVDDRFPMTSRGDWLCSFSKIEHELWISVIEKAYMKLNGGYDFPGSVSGIDLYALTGWIPEVHRLGEDGVESFTQQQREDTWSKLLSASSHGDVLMTVATGQMSKVKADQLGLVPTHAYAVLEVRESEEEGGVRLLKLKNPWRKTRWKGNYSPYDMENWTPHLCRELEYSLKQAQQVDNGIFWIDYDSLLNYFSTLYLNWNPKLFETQIVTHKKWPQTNGPKDDSIMVGENPQYELTVNVPEDCPDDGIVWILLTRHVTDKMQLLSEDKGDFLTLNVYDRKDGKRIYYPEQPMIRGTYSNNPHCLITFQVKPGLHKYTLVVSLFEKTRAMNYTLSVYASKHCEYPKPTLKSIPISLPFTKQIISEWDKETGGGCPRYQTYMENPQWSITFAKDVSQFHIRLLAPVTFPINLRIFDTSKKYKEDNNQSLRVDCPAPKIEVGSSNQYRKGFCVLEIHQQGILKKGVPYTIVPSAFTPNLHGPFHMYIESDVSFKLSPIPWEGTGMHERIMYGSWKRSLGTAAGCPNFGLYHNNPSIEFECSQPAGVNVIARLQFKPENPETCSQWPSINLAVFPKSVFLKKQSRLTLEDCITNSNKGVYMNPPTGAVVEEFLFPPGQYVLVPSTFQPEIDGEFQIRFYSSSPVAVHPPKDTPNFVAVARRILDEIEQENKTDKPPPPPPPVQQDDTTTTDTQPANLNRTFL